ncbi:MAG: TRAP transporter small permease [Succinatimonas sp.]|nr:TRAP transporter small permease [Succinatimonas sp.]
MESLIKFASKVNKGLCCALLIAMVGFVFVNTALRYFFSSGIIITEELVRYLFLWGTYLGVISVWYNRSHIAVTTITDRLTARQKIIFSGCFEIVSIIVLLTLAYGSYLYYNDTTTVGQVTGIPYSVMILAVLIGTISCAIISIGHIKQDLDLLKLDDATLERMAKEQEEAMLNPKEEE